MVVGDQEVRRDQKSGAVATLPAAQLDPRHRPRRDGAAREIADRLQLVAVDDPLERVGPFGPEQLTARMSAGLSASHRN